MAEQIGAKAALESLTGWGEAPGQRDAIRREFKFSDFKKAWAFMSASALKAEQMDHHPEWSNVYGTVIVLLTTHDADGVTALDVELAQYMNQLAKRFA